MWSHYVFTKPFWIPKFLLEVSFDNDFGINPLILEFDECQGESRQQVRVKGEALEKLGEGFIADIQHLDGWKRMKLDKVGWFFEGWLMVKLLEKTRLQVCKVDGKK